VFLLERAQFVLLLLTSLEDNVMDFWTKGSSLGLLRATRAHVAGLLFAVVVGLSPQPGWASITRVTTTLSISPSNSVVAGSTVTLTARVMDGTIPVTHGVVVFCDANAARCEGSAIFGTAQLTGSGSATLRQVFGVGSYSIQAIFQGSITSSPQPLTVSGNASYPSATTIKAGGTAGDYTLTGTVSVFGREVPVGTVSFLDTSNSNSVVGSTALNPLSLVSKLIPAPGSPTMVGMQPDLVAGGDFNNDGVADLVVANSGENTISVLLGKGNGTFQPPAKFSAGRSPYAIAAGDFNGDGNLDVAVTNRDDNTVSLLLGNGDGTFRTQTAYAVGNSPLGIAIADFNLDGNADVVVANANDNTVSILLGNGDGTLQPQVAYPAGSLPYGIAVADFNGDATSDVAVASSSNNSLSVLLGNGDGTFQPQILVPVGNDPLYTVALDLNGDGIPDLVAANYKDDTISVLMGNGDGTFQTQVAYAAGSGAFILASGDFNADGKTDLAVTNFNDSTVSVYLGNGDGTLQPQVVYPVGQGASGLVSGDFNGDGLQDLASANYTDGSVSALLAGFTETATATGVSVLGRGTHNVLASYSGDTNQAGSQSSTVPLIGVQTSTSTTLGASPNPATVGQAVTLTATITPPPTGNPTGSVSFYDGATLLGTATVKSAGVATFVTSSLWPGSHTLSAAFSGNVIFAASTSSALAFIELQAATSTTLSASPNPATVGQSATLTATISPAPTGNPDGSVGFYNGTTLLGTAPVKSAGIATFVISSLSLGSHTLSAAYSGNAIFLASTSSALALTVQTASTFTVTAPQIPLTVNPGGSAKATVTVAPAGGTFRGVVTMSASGLPPGATASFSPATVIPGSAGQATVLTIQTSPQASSLMGMPNPQFLIVSMSLAAGVCLMGRRRKQLFLLVAFAILTGGTLTTTGCQGLTTTNAQTQSYGITVSGTSGSVRSATTVTLVVQ
jgi:hypothetical protein